MQINSKIQEIVQQYISNKAKLWNIDTNIYQTWSRFHKEICQKFGTNIDMKTITVFTIRRISDKNEYIFLINNIELKPYKNKTSWSASGMRQFLQEAEALGFIVFDSEKLHRLLANEEYVGQLTNLIVDVFTDGFIENFHWYLVRTMQKAIYSSATYVRNLGFSLFMSLLYAKNLNQSCENICIEKKMNKKILGKSSNKILTFGNNEYQQYIKKCYDETYRNCIDVIIKNYQINDIIECFENTCINKTLTFLPSIQERKNEALLIKIANFNALVENERKLLKEKIIKQRVINPIKHNDLENCFPKYWYIEDCEACHIFDIYRIKELGRKHIYNGNEHLLTNLLDDCSNPNNGLLLLSQWHDYFDKDLISFNTNGEIVLLIEKDKEDRLEPINPNNNIAKVKIKNQYFNGKMEKYFAKRN